MPDTCVARRIFAPAKINLTLQVTGRRADGYHLLESLVAFVDIGDDVFLAPAYEFSFVVDGPFANAFTAAERDASPASRNLAVRAYHAVAKGPTLRCAYAMRLVKNLPLAAGIGGGSSDAAAVVRGLGALEHIAPASITPLLLSLGADVPACFDARPVWMSGIGEDLTPAPVLPEAGIVLVNPNVYCATAAVFAMRDSACSVARPRPDVFASLDALISFMQTGGNDLSIPAQRLVPKIGTALSALQAMPGCALALMSGSGATCYGLFPDRAAAGEAADIIRERFPAWWVQAGGFLEPRAS